MFSIFLLKGRVLRNLKFPSLFPLSGLLGVKRTNSEERVVECECGMRGGNKSGKPRFGVDDHRLTLMDVKISTNMHHRSPLINLVVHGQTFDWSMTS